jgi:hypothetical protein
MTRLGDVMQAGAAIAAPALSVQTPLARKLSGGRRGELVEVPGLGPVWMELLGPVQWAEIEAACFADLRAKELELTTLTAEIFEMSRARRTLAIACRDPDRRGEPFGTLEQWGELVDTSTLNMAWNLYGDVQERLDPAAGGLTPTEAAAIHVAVKKKNTRPS